MKTTSLVLIGVGLLIGAGDSGTMGPLGFRGVSMVEHQRSDLVMDNMPIVDPTQTGVDFKLIVVPPQAGIDYKGLVWPGPMARRLLDDVFEAPSSRTHE